MFPAMSGKGRTEVYVEISELPVCCHKAIYSSKCFILQYISINISKASRLLSHTLFQLIYLQLLVSTILTDKIYKFFNLPSPCFTS